MKKFIVALALLLGVYFLFTRLADLESIAAVFKRGNGVFLGLALIAQLAWLYNMGAFYQSIYKALGMEEKRIHLAKMAASANFLTVIAPSAGLSSIAIFLADAKHNGRSPAKVTVAGALYVWFEYLGTLTVSTLGLAELARRNNLHWPEVAASLVLVAGAIGMGVLFYLGMRSANALGRTLAWMAGVVNGVTRPFLRRDYLHKDRAYTFSRELAEGISALRGNPRWAYRPLLFTFTNKALLLVVMLMCFFAFQVPVNPGTVVAGLGLAQLFLIVSPTPAGIGIVEGILAVALRSLGVQGEAAAVVALAYRGYCFWLPFLVGMFTLRNLTHGKKPALTVAEVEATQVSLLSDIQMEQ